MEGAVGPCLPSHGCEGVFPFWWPVTKKEAQSGRAFLNLWSFPSGRGSEPSLATGAAYYPPASGICCAPLSRDARGSDGDEGGITPARVGRAAGDGLGAAGLYSRHS